MHQTTESRCTCGELLDCAMDVLDGETAPSPGDYSVCARCGQILLFDEDLHARPITTFEMSEVEPEERATLDEMQALVRKMAKKATIEFLLGFCTCGSKFSVTVLHSSPRGPEAGDYILCNKCAQLSILTEDVIARPATASERNNAPSEVKQQVLDFQQNILALGTKGLIEN